MGVSRYGALERFRSGEVDVMVATDVAARGERGASLGLGWASLGWAWDGLG